MWYTADQYTTSFFAEGAAAVDRVILHCDLNSFYASVELLSRP